MAVAASRYRPGGSLVHPAVALPVWLADYFAWHVPPVYDDALRHQAWLIHVEHACYFGTGLLVWWPLVQDVPRRLRVRRARRLRVRRLRLRRAPRPAPRAAPASPSTPFYVHARPRVWGLSPLADQEIAGVTMASEQAIVLFVVFLYWFRRFLAEEGAL